MSFPFSSVISSCELMDCDLSSSPDDIGFSGASSESEELPDLPNFFNSFEGENVLVPRVSNGTVFPVPDPTFPLPPFFTGDVWSSATYPVFPQTFVPPSLPDVSMDPVDLQHIEKNSTEVNLDLDYFAVHIDVSNLLIVGPLIQLVSHCNLKSIQDPIFIGFTFGNVLSMNPILAFEDVDSSYPLRTRFVDALNKIGPLPIVEAECKRKGGMVFKDHQVPTSSIIEALRVCGISTLRFSMYGTKLPLSNLSLHKNLVHILKSSPPEFSYFDIAASCPEEDIVAVSLESVPKRLPNRKVYPYFGYLCDGKIGGFSFSVKNHFDFKFYSLIHHHLLANSKVSWMVPKKKATLLQKQDALIGLLRRLYSSKLLLGGGRMEIRHYQIGFWDAIESFKSISHVERDQFSSWLASFCDGPFNEVSQIHFERISVKKYLLYVDSILTLACVQPADSGILGGGLFFGTSSQCLDEDERAMTEMLLNSFGFFSDHYRRLNFDSDSTRYLWVGLDEFQTDDGTVVLSNVDMIISAAKIIIQDHNDHLQRSLVEVPCDDPDQVIIKDMLKNLRFCSPCGKTQKFQAYQKSSRGFTKAFDSKLELVKFCIHYIDSHGGSPQFWRKFFTAHDKNTLKESLVARSILEFESRQRLLEEGFNFQDHPPDTLVQVVPSSCLATLHNELQMKDEYEVEDCNVNPQQPTDLVFQDLLKNLLWFHPLDKPQLFMTCLHSRHQSYQTDVGEFHSLELLCLSIIKSLQSEGYDPAEWRQFYSQKD